MSKVIRVFMISVVVFFAGGISVKMVMAEGLDTLIAVAKSQADIAREYSDETRAYDSIKRAIEGGSIVKGQKKQAIIDRYGGPVVAVDDSGTGREKLVYKPASSDFFKGPKICLLFAKDGTLDEISVTK
jgi:hypothetical protein